MFLHFQFLKIFFRKISYYHLKKKETWYIQQGSFQFNSIDVENGLHDSRILKEGDSVLIERGQPHQLVSLEENSIVFEVSTQHFDEDSYRVWRGDIIK